MNKSHKSIWNETLGTYVAAAETAAATGRKTSPGRKARRVPARAHAGQLALEQRIVFDAALPATLVEVQSESTAGPDPLLAELVQLEVEEVNAEPAPQTGGESSDPAEVETEVAAVSDGEEVDTADGMTAEAVGEGEATDPEVPAEEDLSVDTAADVEMLESDEAERVEIIFVDASAEGVVEYLDGHPGEVHVLDADRDGVEQMAAVLQGRTGITAIHILSHGNPGELRLGSATLTTSSLEGEHADEMAIIAATLSPDADLLLYGCDVAGGGGAAFIDRLAALTGADVAASTDVTGAAERGGDWVLESTTGTIEAQTLDLEQAGWDGALETTVYDASWQSLVFGANKTNISGTGTTAGNIVRFDSIITIDGQAIDAVVTTTALNNATISTYDSTANPSTEGNFFQPNMTVTTKSTGGSMTFTVEFYKAGTYTGVGTGTAVTLQNVAINSYDIDSTGSTATDRQYQVFKGFSSYELSNATQLVASTQPDGSVKFLYTTSSPANVTDIYADANRVSVYYDSISSFVVESGVDKVGSANVTGTAYFAIDFSVGPDWVGPTTVTETPAPNLTWDSTLFDEAAANDGAVDTVRNITLANGTFTGTDGQPLAGVTVDNVPAGLTAVLTRTSATTATLSFTGTATSHVNADDIGNVTVNFGDAAFTSGNAGAVTGAVRGDISIDFIDPPPNSGPVAVDDAITVTEDTPFTSVVDLDANDTDLDGDALSVVPGTFTTTAGGTIVIAANGSYTYTPPANFNGSDSFNYTVSDGTASDTGTLHITVEPANDPPVLDLDGDDSSGAVGGGSGNGPNLVTNGDFASGDSGFTSDYTTGAGSWVLFSEGTYFIGDASVDWAPGGLDVVTADPFGSTTGSMMYINGSPNAGETYWQQTISVEPNTDYDFSVWATNVNNWSGDSGTGDADPFFELVINGDVVASGQLSYLTAGTWQQFSGTWNSGSAAAVTIQMSSASGASYGNDLAVTGFSLNEVVATPGTGYVTTFTENGPAVAIADIDSAVNDVDDTHIESAVIVLTNALAGDVFSLAGGLPSGISSSIDTSSPGQITVTLTGSATLTDYETALEAIRFANTSDTPDTTDRIVNVTVNDGEANSNTAVATIHVVPANDPPDAVNDSQGASPEADTVLTLLGNDTDPDGDSLTVVSATLANPAQGTLSNVGGVWSFTSAPGVSGTVLINYTIRDPDGLTDSAQHTVNVANQPPELQDPTPGDPLTPEIDPGDPNNLIVPAVDGTAFTPVDLDDYIKDPNTGDTLTYTVDPADVPAWASFDPVTHVLSGTPPADNTGAVVIPVTVDDGQGGSFVGTITIAPVNPAPDAVDDTQAVAPGVATILTLQGNDPADDDAPLTVSATLANPALGTLTLVGGDWVFTSAAGVSGPVVVNYTVTDQDGASDSATHTVNVANLPPEPAPAPVPGPTPEPPAPAPAPPPETPFAPRDSTPVPVDPPRVPGVMPTPSRVHVSVAVSEASTESGLSATPLGHLTLSSPLLGEALAQSSDGLLFANNTHGEDLGPIRERGFGEMAVVSPALYVQHAVRHQPITTDQSLWVQHAVRASQLESQVRSAMVDANNSTAVGYTTLFDPFELGAPRLEGSPLHVAETAIPEARHEAVAKAALEPQAPVAAVKTANDPAVEKAAVKPRAAEGLRNQLQRFAKDRASGARPITRSTVSG